MFFSVNSVIHVTWISVCLVLDVLNVYWFSKILGKVMVALKDGGIQDKHLNTS